MWLSEQGDLPKPYNRLNRSVSTLEYSGVIWVRATMIYLAANTSQLTSLRYQKKTAQTRRVLCILFVTVIFQHKKFNVSPYRSKNVLNLNKFSTDGTWYIFTIVTVSVNERDNPRQIPRCLTFVLFALCITQTHKYLCFSWTCFTKLLLLVRYLHLFCIPIYWPFPREADGMLFLSRIIDRTFFIGCSTWFTR